MLASTAFSSSVVALAGRYSEGIDLVQVDAGAIRPVTDAVCARLDPWLGKPKWKQGRGRVTFYYRFESEMKPVLSSVRDAFVSRLPERVSKK